MAMQIKTDTPLRRGGDLWMVDPRDVFISEENRGRKYAPEPEEIIKLAMSMHDEGQRLPCEARRRSDKRLELVSGFTRACAARLIIHRDEEGNETGFIGNDGTHRYDPEFRLKVLVSDCNSQQALIRNIVENSHRSECSIVDDAYNHAKLRDKYGYSDEQIATLYGIKPAKVRQLAEILTLSDEQQRLIHKGSLSLSAALDLAKLPEAEQQQAVAAATKAETGRVNGAVIRAQVREHHLRDATPPPEATDEESDADKSVALSLKEIKAYWRHQQENSNSEPVRTFADTVLKFYAGKKTVRQMNNGINRLRAAAEDDDA
jgi:hypothetical protein